MSKADRWPACDFPGDGNRRRRPFTPRIKGAGAGMYGSISTLAFVGVEARPVEVQVRISPGQQAFAIVGLPDKAVAESRERVRNALHAVGLGLPYKHITVNLAPADLPKEGKRILTKVSE